MKKTIVLLAALYLSSCMPAAEEAVLPFDRSAVAQRLLDWMTANRHAASRLPYSHVGDPALTNFIILYDCAVSAMAYAAMGRPDDARAILDFYRTNAAVKRLGGLIEVFRMDPVFSGIDWSVRMGANLWMGLSAFFVFRSTGQAVYLDMAKNQADFALAWQVTDAGSSNYGGIPLGPAGDTNYPGDQHIGYDTNLPSYTNIFATEIQIDAYALFTVLYGETGLSAYSSAAALLTNWLGRNAHNAAQSRFNRGYQDAVITTDVQSWGVSALGLVLLDSFSNGLATGMLAFAESNCVSSVTFAWPGGLSVTVTGADFVDRNYAAALGRPPLVSPEWTFQLINACRRAGAELAAAGRAGESAVCLARADFLLDEMIRLAVPQGNALAYPYATLGNALIGNENRTPADGNLSVIGNAYGILVLKGFDPLDSTR